MQVLVKYFDCQNDKSSLMGALELDMIHLHCLHFADSMPLHTSSKSGGLKLLGKLSSHFQPGHIAYSSESIWAEPPRGSDAESATQSMFMVGTESLCGSSYGLQMGNMVHPSVS